MIGEYLRDAIARGCKSCMLACPFGAMTVVASASGTAIKYDLAGIGKRGRVPDQCVTVLGDAARAWRTLFSTLFYECRSYMMAGIAKSLRARSISLLPIFYAAPRFCRFRRGYPHTRTAGVCAAASPAREEIVARHHQHAARAFKPLMKLSVIGESLYSHKYCLPVLRGIQAAFFG